MVQQQSQSEMKTWKTINPWVALMAWTFALSSWIDVQGLWTQMPIMVDKLPEAWTFPSYVVVLIQCAMIVPLTYGVIARRCSPSRRSKLEVVMCYVITGIGLAALLLLIFFWDITVTVAGVERSIPCLILVLFLSMVDTTSSVVYLPYMARFKPVYITAFVVGEESSGFIAGGLGLVQGIGGNDNCANTTNISNSTSVDPPSGPLFSLSAFLGILAVIMALSMAAFTALNFAPFAQKERADPSNEQYGKVPQQEKVERGEDCVEIQQTEPAKQNTLIFFLFFWTSCMAYGMFPSVQAFSCLPYGSLAYTLAIRVTCIVNPISAILSFVCPCRSMRVITGLVFVSSCSVAYHIFLASQSPYPPLHDHVLGKIIVVAATVLQSGTFAYCRASMFGLLRSSGGEKGLFYAGASVQSGAFVGGVTGFILVNIAKVFQRAPPC